MFINEQYANLVILDTLPLPIAIEDLKECSGVGYNY